MGDRTLHDQYNRGLGLDGRLSWRDRYSFSFQGAQSWARDPDYRGAIARLSPAEQADLPDDVRAPHRRGHPGKRVDRGAEPRRAQAQHRNRGAQLLAHLRRRYGLRQSLGPAQGLGLDPSAPVGQARPMVHGLPRAALLRARLLPRRRSAHRRGVLDGAGDQPAEEHDARGGKRTAFHPPQRRRLLQALPPRRVGRDRALPGAARRRPLRVGRSGGVRGNRAGPRPALGAVGRLPPRIAVRRQPVLHRQHGVARRRRRSISLRR